MEKFLFDFDFDGSSPPPDMKEDLAGLAMFQPAGSVPDPQATTPQSEIEVQAEIAEPEPEPLPQISEEQLQAARQEAYQQGLQEGRATMQAEMLTTLEGQTTQALTAIAERIPMLAQITTDNRAQMEVEACEVALHVLRRLYPETSRRHGFDEITALLTRVLQGQRKEPHLVVRMHESQLDALEERLGGLQMASGFEGKIVTLTDPSLSPGDVLVEWADGGAERNGERFWQDIDQALALTLNSTSNSTETPETDEESSSMVGQGS